MGYYIDQMAERDRKMRLADLFGGMGGSEDFTVSQPQQQPMPENFLRNQDTGATYDLGPSRQAGPALDYSSPIEIGGYGKGYRIKGDPMSAVLSDGRIVRMGADTGADRKRQMEDIALQKAQQGVANDQTEGQIKQMQLAELMGFQMPGVSGKPRDLKLKPGEMFNAQTQQVEAVPGSELYQKQSGLHAKDRDALEGAKFKTQGAINKVDEILNNQSGFESNFGGYNAILSQYLPGEATDTRKKIEGLKSDLKMAGLEMMRSGGSIGMMTEREWPIVEQMVANISPTLSEKEAAFQLAKVKTYMQNIAKKANESYQSEWGNSQFAGKQAPQLKPGSVEDGHVYLGGNPADPKSWKKAR